MTQSNDYIVKVELQGASGTGPSAEEYHEAVYHTFRILDNTYYTLEVNNYNSTLSTAADSWTVTHNGVKFSTKDVENDAHSTLNCAQEYNGPNW